MLSGIAASGGFAIGKVLKLSSPETHYDKGIFRGKKQEWQRFEKALKEYSEKTQAVADSIRRIVGQQEADIFKGHIYMANDPEFKEQIRRKIVVGFCAEAAAESACEMYIDRFLKTEGELIRLRAADLRDVKQRLLETLCQKKSEKKVIPFGSVLAAEELTPSAVRLLERRRTVALLDERSGRSSHLAILARAMGIPAVLSVKGLMNTLKEGQRVIVDANKGEIVEID